MSINRAVNVDEVRKLAKKTLPRICFDFIEGGVEDEIGLERNRDAFRRHALLPRYLVDVSKRDQTATIFGRTFASPFGISPTGVLDLFRPGSDRMLAEEAAKANIPFVGSTNTAPSIEQLTKIAPHNGWMQIYGSHDEKITLDMVRRGREAGVETMVFTVDVPVAPRRERNLRNGFSRPFKMRWDIMLEAMAHPRWVIEYLRSGGLPTMGNWVPYASPGSDANGVADFFGTQTPAGGQTWHILEAIRSQWPGNLVVKGILHPEDAIRATNIGANGILVSNHGGRQLDRAPSPLEMLPLIKAAVGDRSTLMVESGVRRGSDIIIALCLGAKFTFFGRPTAYGAAAAGNAGIRKVIEIVRTEIDAVMAQIGAPDLASLGPHFIFQPQQKSNRTET
jgi:L-lactate dehydrogenase (cytochrome)/(S)-mandelate dehydrogenase